MDGDTSTPALGNDQYTKLLLGFDDSYYDSSDAKHGTMSDGGGNSFSSDTTFSGTKGGGKSLYFSQDNAYIYIGDNDDWYLSGDFTIDTWLKLDNISRDHGFIGQDDGGTNAWHVKVRSDWRLQFAIRKSSSWTMIFVSDADKTVSHSEWTHVAVTRSGNNWYMFINGVLAGSTTNSETFPNISGQLKIGDTYGDAGFRGRLDDLRISKGIARWTSAFTPHTEPYGGHKFQINNAARLDASVKKFGSASFYFDGDTTLKAPKNYDFDLFSDDFTIDCWVRFDSLSANRAIVGSRYDGNNVWGIVWQTNNVLMLFGALGGSNRFNWQCPWTPSVDTWYHVAVVRDGSSCKMFIDGDSKTVTDYESGWGTWTSTNATLDIGLYGDGTGIMYGYMDEFRISKGIARWTSNFTPPTSEYTTDYYTKLLLHFKADQSGNDHTLYFNDETQFMLEPTKWSGSFHFDGNDYMRVAASTDFDLTDKDTDWTIDFWFRASTSASNQHLFSIGDPGSIQGLNIQIDATGGYLQAIGSEDGVGFTLNIKDTVAVSTSEWVHVALTNDGGTVRLFKNGTLVNTDTLSSDLIFSDNEITLGSHRNHSSAFFDNGFMDEIRLDKGTAHWTTNFTPPTEPYTIYQISGDLSDTVRLLAINETDWSITENTIVSGSSYTLYIDNNDPHTLVGRKSDGDSSGYGNVVPE